MSVSPKHKQLVFPFAHAPSISKESFVRGQCNEQAFKIIEGWQDWPQRMMCLVGPEGTGKTHLSHIWAGMLPAAIIDARMLSPDVLLSQTDISREINSADALVIDKADECENETALFHLYNISQEMKLYVLFLCRQDPQSWPYNLEDLLSRARTLPVTYLKKPDDAVLQKILIKLFQDRQLLCPEEVLDFALARMERSARFAMDLVEVIDQTSMASQKPITKKLVSQSLDILFSEASESTPS